jgi:hypothetical protein
MNTSITAIMTMPPPLGMSSTRPIIGRPRTRAENARAALGRIAGAAGRALNHFAAHAACHAASRSASVRNLRLLRANKPIAGAALRLPAPV